MIQYDYIGVSLHGHFDGRLSVRYAYTPTGIDPAQWQAPLPDPEFIVRNFVSARECYVMWQNEIGHYFSVIAPNPADPRSGHSMVTVMLPSGIALPGQRIFRVLSVLKKVLLEEGRMTDEAVEQALAQVGLSPTPMKLPSWKSSAPKADVKPLCYRTYLSTREFDNLFSFPNQAEYENYSYTIIITVTCSLRQNVAIDRIATPVKKRYSVIVPAGVEASAEIVAEGERLQLTFNKDGYKPRVESVTAGSPSPYIKYEGAAMIVKSPNESGMGFTRRIRINVSSSKGGIINGYTLTVNDRPVNTMEPYIELTEHDLVPGGRITIQAASNNFHPIKHEISASEVTEGQVINLAMNPIEQGIILRLAFGDGRIFEQNISLERNTPEYSQLHSGNFHGFRAHRQTGEGEIYVIDCRPNGKPVALNIESAESKVATVELPKVTKQPENNGYRKPVAPTFENVSDRAGKVDLMSDDDKDSKSGSDRGDSQEKRPLPWRLIASLAVLVAVVVLACVFLPRLRGGSEEVEGNSGIPVLSDAPEQPTEQTPARPTAEELNQMIDNNADKINREPAAASAASEEDWKYLNENSTWRRDALKSPEGQALFNAIAAGDIRAIANSPYFAQNKATNKNAIKLIEFAWASLGTPHEKGNVEQLKKFGAGESIVVFDLMDQLSRRQHTTPNPEPRPGKNQQ